MKKTWAIYGVFCKDECLYVGSAQRTYEREIQHKSRFGETCELRVFQEAESPVEAALLEGKYLKQYQKQGQAKYNKNGRSATYDPLKPKTHRIVVTIDRKWHQRFKMLSAHFDRKLEDLYDEAAAAYLADQPMFTRHASQNVR